jgi:hypothetical protein
MSEHEGDWISAMMSCSECLHWWVAVFPSDAEYLECPRCHFALLPAPIPAELPREPDGGQ